MKVLTFIALGLLLQSTFALELGEWTQDVAAAQELARKENKYTLLNFTGSDWCGWCKLMDEHVFSQPGWKNFAKQNLALAVVDTPKNAELVPEKFRQRNKDLKRKYKVTGFPTFVILGADGHLAGQTGAINHGDDYTFITNVIAVFVEDQMPKLVSAEELREYREAQDERAAWEAEKDRIQEQFKQKYAIPHQQVTDVIDKGKLSLIQKGRERWRKALVANEFAKDVDIVFSDFGKGVITNGAAFGKWTTDYGAAMDLAKKSGRDMLLAFVGTNWCKWGNEMEKDVFNTMEWMNFAKEHFVQVYIDCPDEAGEANLPEWQLDRNAELYKAYQLRGCPFYILTDANGKRYDEFGATSRITPKEQIDAVELLLTRKHLKDWLSAEDFAMYTNIVARENVVRKEWRQNYDAFIDDIDELVERFQPIADKRNRIFEKAMRAYNNTHKDNFDTIH